MKGYYLKFRYIAEIFLIASFMGWIYESVWYSMVEKKWKVSHTSFNRL